MSLVTFLILYFKTLMFFGGLIAIAYLLAKIIDTLGNY